MRKEHVQDWSRSKMPLQDWLRSYLPMHQATAVLDRFRDLDDLADALEHCPENFIGISNLTEKEAFDLHHAYHFRLSSTTYLAVLGQHVPIFQNGGRRDGRVVRITKTRVRIEWPKVEQGRQATAGRWFRNDNGVIGDPSRCTILSEDRS